MSLGRCLLLIVTMLMEVSTGQDEPLVTAPAGTFRGRVLTSFSGVEYASYRGIPYALPPTGEKRFAKPEPHPPLEGVYDALEFGSVCLQNMEQLQFGQEDCLFLNVYTPLRMQEDGLVSVLVYNPGGGLTTGTGNTFVPGDLVTRADIVVVTLNHRLGWLGFLRGNSSSLPGNQGFWDQLLALRWVKENIRAFGGDPDDITSAGCSSGSWTTSLFSISPLGKGLFNKVLLMPGTVFTFADYPRTSNDLLQMISEKVSCSVGSVTGNEDDVVKCLKLKKAENFDTHFTIKFFAQLISSGEDFLPRPIQELLDDLDYLSDVGFFDRDYFISFIEDDSFMTLNAPFFYIKISSFDACSLTLSETFHITQNVARHVLKEYVQIYGRLEKAFTILTHDIYILQQSLKLLEVYGKNPNQRKTRKNAYFMSFDHSPKYFLDEFIAHGLDLIYLFDIDLEIYERFNLTKIKGGFYEEDFRLKADYIDLIASFVKTGNPNNFLKKKKNMEWPPFDQNKKSYLSFSVHPEIKEDVLANRRNILDTLLTTGKDEL